MNYYNEFDPQAAQWLRNLIAAGLIPAGDVDERSIEDVIPNELRGYTQCHFFAGIAGWSLALDLAGWPRDRPVWTGSCPCQPFSAAGKGDGFADERHLWPAFQHLIAQCRPPVVFGEQVASKATDAWVDLVHADLENLDYAFGCIPFPAAGVGAPHIRDRNYWVGLADPDNARLEGRGAVRQRATKFAAGPRGVAGRLADAEGARGRQDAGAVCEGKGERIRDSQGENIGRPEQQNRWLVDCSSIDRPGPTNGQWRAADWLACTDGKWRPVEPGTFPLAHGIPARVVRLRAYGNSIVPQAAAEFIRASGLVAGASAR